MKKIYYLILLLLIACGLLTSCADDGSGLLDKAESGDLNEERVFSNANYAGQFLTDIYRRMPNAWFENVYLDAATDLGEARPWWGWVNTIHNGGFSASSIPGRLSRWADYYAAIRACNKFLEHIDDVPADMEASQVGAIKDEPTRIKRKAECYALRAYFYGELLRCFGGVPIITKVLDIDSPELYTPRATIEETINQIISDCDIAIPNLPFRATGNEYPRMTAMTAKAIKARALLIAASPIFNDDKDSFGNPFPENCPYGWGNYDKEHWKRAADAAMDVINFTSDPTGQMTGTYGLVVMTDNTANYSATNNAFTKNGSSYPGSAKAFGWQQLFIQLSNSEVFISNPYKGNTNELEKWQMPGSFNGTGDASYTLPTYNYAAMFENKDGIPIYQTDENDVPIWDSSTGDFKINPASGFNSQKPYDNRDSRFYHSIYYQGATFSKRAFNCWNAFDGRKGPEWQVGYANTGLFLRKFLNPAVIYLDGGGLIQGQTSHRYPLFRYVEFLLAYAEAMNEYLDDGADRSLVIVELNKIRARAGMPDVTATFQLNGWSTTDKAQMRKFIRRERTIELAFEDNRYYDVKRWKIGEQTQKVIYAHDIFLQENGSIKYGVKVWERRVYLPQYNLFPIPQSEINNNKNMIQNPGW
ncbi:carbohydrate-binding protein [Bacteroidia bacterium]|nr:carbohydrate-binding protein [Bacteroidia bacterium]